MAMVPRPSPVGPFGSTVKYQETAMTRAGGRVGPSPRERAVGVGTLGEPAAERTHRAPREVVEGPWPGRLEGELGRATRRHHDAVGSSPGFAQSEDRQRASAGGA